MGITNLYFKIHLKKCYLILNNINLIWLLMVKKFLTIGLFIFTKKALSERISKAELAWILLSFNQKRGYFQFRDEVDDNIDDDFFIISSEVLEVNRLEKDKKMTNIGMKFY